MIRSGSLYMGIHGFVFDDSMVPPKRSETREYRSEAKVTPEFGALGRDS